MQYQFVCEIEREGRVPEEIVFSVDLPPGRTQFTCPAEFTSLSLDGEVKYEIITKLANNNQTAIESCFSWISDDADWKIRAADPSATGVGVLRRHPGTKRQLS